MRTEQKQIEATAILIGWPDSDEGQGFTFFTDTEICFLEGLQGLVALRAYYWKNKVEGRNPEKAKSGYVLGKPEIINSRLITRAYRINLTLFEDGE